MRAHRPHETDARMGGNSRIVGRRRCAGAGSDHADARAAAGQPGYAAAAGLGAVAHPNKGADRSAEDAILPQRSLKPAARARESGREPWLAAISRHPATATAARPVDFAGSLPVVPAKAGTHFPQEAEG